jgi:hypothetical protein
VQCGVLWPLRSGEPCSVRAAISARTKPRSALARFSDEQQLLYRQGLRYSATVRRMSRANLQRYADILNPKGHKLGRSGVPGAYQLDHIVRHRDLAVFSDAATRSGSRAACCPLARDSQTRAQPGGCALRWLGLLELGSPSTTRSSWFEPRPRSKRLLTRYPDRRAKRASTHR